MKNAEALFWKLLLLSPFIVIVILAVVVLFVFPFFLPCR